MSRDDPPPMKSHPTFQIKVALIGNVSAGKTTVVNALLRDKYGEVSMKRTTAGVNEFAISSRHEWALVSDAPRDSHSVLKEIEEDNVELRASEEVKTKRFEIELEEALCEMHKDTQLVIVDIPGINEADMSRKYKNYVESHWNTFDCVVVVMDGRQGVNTEEQVSLLRFVKDNLESKKDVPVVILCNKIDDQDDEEQRELVLEAQHEVEKIFGVSDRKTSLEEILEEDSRSKHKKAERTVGNQISPVFIPISGITAFVFQACSNMSLERFRQFDEKLIAKLGRERIGKLRWKKLSKEEKIKEAHEAVSDPEGYQEGVADSNFDKFLLVLSFLVGGKDVQEKMIKEQIRISLTTISSGPGIADKLESVYQTVVALSLEGSEEEAFLAEIKSTFWRLCKGMEPSYFAPEKSSTALEAFVCLAHELKKCGTFASTVGWNPELSVVFFNYSARRFLDSIHSTPGFVKDLKAVHCAMKEMSLDAEDSPTVEALRYTFDRLFRGLTEEKFTAFTSTDTVRQLALLVDELVGYSNLATEAGWTNVQLAIAAKFKELVLRQIGTLCELASNGPLQQHFGYTISSKSTAFTDFSLFDWKLALRSILVLRYDRQFCLDFGREMVLMECLLENEPKGTEAMKTKEQCPECKWSVLTFNKICTQCRTPVVVRDGHNTRCFRSSCNSNLRFNLHLSNHYSSGVKRYGCILCSRIHSIRESPNLEPHEVKHTSPDCEGHQDLDYNCRCGSCRVLFCPPSEDDRALSVCPMDGSALDLSTENAMGAEMSGNISRRFTTGA